ncbi:peptidoglycan DD-metalloendopeptidase family protein [Bacteroidota bacterium]
MFKIIYYYVAFIILLFLSSGIYAQEFRLKRPAPDNIQTHGGYLYGESRFWDTENAHRAIDIWLDYDTVYSASNGTVYFIGYNPTNPDGYEPTGCGNYIFIKSKWESKDLFLLYCHLSKPLVSDNQNISEGQPLAISGNTGNSTGPHLHFELRLGSSHYATPRSRRNPELWCGMSGTGAIFGNIQGAEDNTKVDITPDPKPRPPYTTFSYALTYRFSDPTIGSDDVYNENYAIGDVKPGNYIITALNGGYTREVKVEPGKIINADVSTKIDDVSIKNLEFKLFQNYPNPFNPTTSIVYYTLNSSYVIISVYNLLGKVIKEIYNSYSNPGYNTIIFDGTDLSTGTYIYTILIISNDGMVVNRESKKMLLIK